MPASATPPSLALKNLVWVVFGLPSTIDHATTVPSRLTASGLLFGPTLTWKPVVRLTARHGLAGQLGTVAGIVAGTTPTSASVAEEPAGSASASPRPARIARETPLIAAIQHGGGVDVAVRTLRYAPLSSCATAAISCGSPAVGIQGSRSGSPS